MARVGTPGPSPNATPSSTPSDSPLNTPRGTPSSGRTITDKLAANLVLIEDGPEIDLTRSNSSNSSNSSNPETRINVPRPPIRTDALDALRRFENLADLSPAQVKQHVPMMLNAIASLVNLEFKDVLREDPPAPYSMLENLGTNAKAAMCFYLLSFGLAKVVGNTAAMALAAQGLTRLIPMTAWTNPALIPLASVVLSEPVGLAVRASGPTRGSPDSAAFANYGTAQASWLEARIKGDEAGVARYTKIMADIVDGLIKRERADNSRVRFVSGCELPDRNEDGTVVEGQKDPAWTVMAYCMLRALLSDELGFMFFSLNAGVTGAIAGGFNKLFGPILGRLVDMFTHMAGGGLLSALELMLLQDVLRYYIQGAARLSPTDKGNWEYIKDHTASKAEHHQQVRAEMHRLVVELRQCQLALRLRQLEADPPDPEIDALRKDLDEILSDLEPALKSASRAEMKARRNEEIESSAFLKLGRSISKTYRHYAGEKGQQKTAFLDGRNIIIRNCSKMVAYTCALLPSAYSAYALGMHIWNQAQVSPAADVPTGAMGVDGRASKDLATTQAELDNIFHASSLTVTFIIPWITRSLLGTVIVEHAAHMTLGLGSLAVKKAKEKLGIESGPPPAAPVPVNVRVEAEIREKSRQFGKRDGDTLEDVRVDIPLTQRDVYTPNVDGRLGATTHIEKLVPDPFRKKRRGANRTSTTYNKVNTTNTTTDATRTTRTTPVTKSTSVTTNVHLSGAARRTHNIDGESEGESNS